MTARLAMGLLLGLCAARPAMGQDPRLAGRLDAGTRAAVEALVDSARLGGLPSDPLVTKALEGASKGATGARIVAAVRRLSGDLAAARTALGSGSTAEELVAGAAALRAGASASALQQVRSVRSGATVAVHLAVLADLLADGVPADTAAAAVVALARATVRDADLVAFRQSVDRDIALGASPGAAATVRVNSTARAGDLIMTAVPNAPPRRRP
jgi:hypothetical protein